MGTKLVVRRVSSYARGRFVTLSPASVSKDELGSQMVGFVIPDGSVGPLADAKAGDTYILELAKLGA